MSGFSTDSDIDFGREMVVSAPRTSSEASHDQAARRRAERCSQSRLPHEGERIHIERSLDRYLAALGNLQVELNKLQAWIKKQGLKVVVVFEGRDAAGKGGCIRCITETLNPRCCRVVALPAPSERERTQWYFQRYMAHLPAAGEMVLYDRSWYNRAGVERVMGFCTEDEYQSFLRMCPIFENEMLVRSGIILLKYWIDIDRETQDLRLQDRLHNPTKRWKLSKMDLESRERWDSYTLARDEMFKATHRPEAPWYVVDGNCKKLARLNCIRHLLASIPYKEVVDAGLPSDLPPVITHSPDRSLIGRHGPYKVVPAVYQ